MRWRDLGIVLILVLFSVTIGVYVGRLLVERMQ